MNFILHNENIRYLTCKAFDDAGIRHMFTTRVGGVSTGAFSSLNFAEGGGEITDSAENVLRNYEIVSSRFSLHANDICRTYQSHTSNVLVAAEEHRGVGITKPKLDFGTDGLVTATHGLLLSVRTADCVPILLYDKKASICAAVHSGWRGTAGKISENAVKAMISLGADASRIIAAIGPCAEEKCYRVGDELKEFFPPECFCEYADGAHLNLVKANRLVLEGAGIKSENIYESGCCTVCDRENFYSHRRDGAIRGCMGAFICV